MHLDMIYLDTVYINIMQAKHKGACIAVIVTNQQR